MPSRYSPHLVSKYDQVSDVPANDTVGRLSLLIVPPGVVAAECVNPWIFSSSTTIAASLCRDKWSHPGNGQATSITMFAVLSGSFGGLVSVSL